jgi:homoserine O-acetyltransferase/O-succinyltransferase
MKLRTALLILFVFLAATFCFAFDWPKPNEGDYTVKDFQFADGEKLPELRLHYLTWGDAKRDAQGHVTNAILILHSTGGSSGQFLKEYFAGALFNPGQILDVTKYYIIMPDSIGHGKSSKPSDGLHAKFPAYRYADMVRAQQMLVADHLKVDHLRLVMGMSMGCMHAWIWAESYPAMMDGVMPLACLPVEIAGRNRMWRKAAHDAITQDPEYNNGDYAHPVHGLATAEQILALVGSNPRERQKKYPTGEAAEKFMDETAANAIAHIDGNDLAYALDSSLGYNPDPKLSQIPVPVLAINFGDDLINPPELRIFEPEVKKVPKGRAILIPASDQTHGHGTHTYADFWKQYLQEFLQETAH